MKMKIKTNTEDLTCERCKRQIKTNSWYLGSVANKLHARCHYCSQAVNMSEFELQLKGKPQVWSFVPVRIIDDNDFLMRLDLKVGGKFEPITYFDLEVNDSEF